MQERLYQQLLDSGFLRDTERDVLRWGRNATGALEWAPAAPHRQHVPTRRCCCCCGLEVLNVR